MAVKAFEKALKIYGTKNQMKEFDLIKEKIKCLHEHMRKMLLTTDKALLPKQIQDQMVDKKTKEVNITDLKHEELSEEAKRPK